MKKLIICAFTILNAITVPAVSGDSAHGGNVVICKGKPVVILDYYHATLKTVGGKNPELLDFNGLNERGIVDKMLSHLELYPDLANNIVNKINIIGPVDSWIAADLKQFNDSFEPYHLAPGCTRRLVAVRQNSTMYGDANIIKKISTVQKAVLLLHEALYWIAVDSGLYSSDSTRELVAELLKQNPNQLLLLNKVKALHNNRKSFGEVYFPLLGSFNLLEEDKWVLFFGGVPPYNINTYGLAQFEMTTKPKLYGVIQDKDLDNVIHLFTQKAPLCELTQKWTCYSYGSICTSTLEVSSFNKLTLNYYKVNSDNKCALFKSYHLTKRHLKD